LSFEIFNHGGHRGHRGDVFYTQTFGNRYKDLGEQNGLALQEIERTRTLLDDLGKWEVELANPVFSEPAD
jgi:hypothetical protein